MSSTTMKPSIYRLSSSSHPKRTLLNQYLDSELLSQDGNIQKDYHDLMSYLDKSYLNENLLLVINDLKVTLNSDD
ncbi:unnamed protein product [Rotaria socialis]|uniref:Uncharacterized protein n=1 Tax=Rotaria socialis TaxID=392032 RepID=A0A817TMZ8_9BILA|nr:unnamed protein product [Rotaria socialis]CAF3324940.1 unnamed protein product [Rotaria socialis]CAF4296715.1 unnamed protein product [Rotaria socialis]CAF4489746.1 unnamed protein product [Rotaria socialis]CAF4498034.1 unnamed protein product [Rotaria socialis]